MAEPAQHPVMPSFSPDLVPFSAHVALLYAVQELVRLGYSVEQIRLMADAAAFLETKVQEGTKEGQGGPA